MPQSIALGHNWIPISVSTMFTTRWKDCTFVCKPNLSHVFYSRYKKVTGEQKRELFAIKTISQLISTIKPSLQCNTEILFCMTFCFNTTNLCDVAELGPQCWCIMQISHWLSPFLSPYDAPVYEG